jgi:hypothetical protein
MCPSPVSVWAPSVPPQDREVLLGDLESSGDWYWRSALGRGRMLLDEQFRAW